MAFDGTCAIYPSQWQLALSGELQEYLEQAETAILRAARNALMNVASEGKERLRGLVVKAGLGREGSGDGRGSGRSLASAVRFEVYPKHGLARDPAALLYIQPSATKIYESFEEGVRITAAGGRYLTIPIPGSPASREVFGDKPRGTTILQRLKDKGIEIAFVPGNGRRPAMLVANSVRIGQAKNTGRTRLSNAKRTKAGAFASGATSVPLFWLVPAAQMPQKLSLRREFMRIAERFVDVFAREFAAELAKVERAKAEAA